MSENEILLSKKDGDCMSSLFFSKVATHSFSFAISITDAFTQLFCFSFIFAHHHSYVVVLLSESVKYFVPLGICNKFLWPRPGVVEWTFAYHAVVPGLESCLGHECIVRVFVCEILHSTNFTNFWGSIVCLFCDVLYFLKPSGP